MCLDRAQCRRNLKKSALSWKTAYINSSINVQTLGLVLIVKKKKIEQEKQGHILNSLKLLGKCLLLQLGKRLTILYVFHILLILDKKKIRSQSN